MGRISPWVSWMECWWAYAVFSLLHCAILAAAAQYGLFIVVYFVMYGFAVNIAFLNILISASYV
jgi:hypothetical protein